MYVYYTVEKKENALIILSAIKIHYYYKFYHFVTMPFSENFAPPFTQSQVRSVQSAENVI